MSTLMHRKSDAEQNEFLDHVWDMVHYWMHEDRRDEAGKLRGLAFSILVALDGGAAVGPYQLRKIGGLEDIAGDLHEVFYRRPHRANDSPKAGT